jgi:hypothetical protein
VHYSTTSNTEEFNDGPLLGNNYISGFSGDIAEVIVYDRVLSDAERTALNTYLTTVQLRADGNFA